MATFSRSTTVERPIAQVWEVWTDVRLLPQLSPSTVEVLDAPERLTEEGQTFRQVVRAVGRCFESTWTVTAISEEHHLTIEGSVGFGVRYLLTEQVRSISPTRTELSILVDYRLPFGPLGRMASKLGIEALAQRETDVILERLVRHLESLPAAARS